MNENRSISYLFNLSLHIATAVVDVLSKPVRVEMALDELIISCQPESSGLANVPIGH